MPALIGRMWLSVSRYVPVANSTGACLMGVAIAALSGCANGATEPGPSIFERPAGRVTSLALTLRGHVIAGSQSDGIFRSGNDGESWEQVLAGVSVRQLATSPTGHLFAATLAGVFRSSDDGKSWTLLSSTAGRPFFLLAVAVGGDVFAGGACSSPGGLFHSATGAGMWRSTDSGDTWERLESLGNSCYFDSLAVTPGGHILYGNTVGLVYRSTDNGETWELMDFGLGLPIGAGIVFASGSGDVWAEIRSHRLPNRWALVRSRDGGDTWEDAELPIAYSPRDVIQTIATSPTRQIFVGTRNMGIYRSPADRYDWQQVNGGLPASPPQSGIVNIAALAANAAGNLYASIYNPGGALIFRSTDNGDHWSQTGPLTVTLVLSP